jgi:hypothetical protein
VSVACLLRLHPIVAVRAAEPTSSPFLTAIRDGWREVSSHPWLRSGLAAMGAYQALVLPAVFVLGPVFISRNLGGPGAWAAVVAAFGLGSITGDLTLLRIRPHRALRAAALGLVLASFQAAVYGAGVSLALTCVLQFATATGVTVFFTLWEVSLQEHVPGEALSRVSSWDYLASTALMPVGTAVAGPLASILGTRDPARHKCTRSRLRARIPRCSIRARAPTQRPQRPALRPRSGPAIHLNSRQRRSDDPTLYADALPAMDGCLRRRRS